MKELSIEQKAKAYDEAIKRVENIRTGKCETTFMFTEGLLEHIFPELAESEDERIKQKLIEFFKDFGKTRSHCWSISIPDILAWLEKQGEQKHQYNSRPRYVGEGELLGKKDTDDFYLKGVQKVCSGEANDEALEKQLQIWFEKGKSQGRDEVIYHPESFGLQKPAEWSEEDENLLKLSIENLTELKDRFGEEYGKVGDCIVWFESIKDRVQPRPHWKPSDEQLYNLSEAAHYRNGFWDCDILIGLYDELKKLREE